MGYPDIQIRGICDNVFSEENALSIYRFMFAGVIRVYLYIPAMDRSAAKVLKKHICVYIAAGIY